MTVQEQINMTGARNRRIAEAMIGRGVSPVAAWRMTLGLGRMDLAERAALDPARLALIERRESLPIRQELNRLCEVLDVVDADLAEREIAEVRTRMYGAH